MFSQDHIGSVKHSKPACKYGKNCTDNTTAHCFKFSHPKEPCKFGVSCNKTSDAVHMKFHSHPFLPPCKNKYHCREVTLHNHKHKYARCHFLAKLFYD